ncbi:uncharacterized protein qrfp [Dunckerocampus dactyliophorus]|uniref:uncharacterized protein qrfp n=1 Tax=Dunckerocampus dactyliophorus TaxID=161453 RepID=UPI00240706C1|nr:uncharacterized protein qrfp [Dunckerocampus dactyliophorus]
MRSCCHHGGSRFTLLSLSLLFPVPPSVMPYPRPPAEESALERFHVPVPMEAQRDLWVWGAWPGDPLEERVQGASWEEEEESPRAHKAMPRPLWTFPCALHVRQAGEEGEGGRLNEALTSIVGGLQSVSREKGGFGFRFGRKRWTNGAWRGRGLKSVETMD